MTDMIDKRLQRYRPRPEARRDDAPGWVIPLVLIGAASTVYTALSVVSALWGW